MSIQPSFLRAILLSLLGLLLFCITNAIVAFALNLAVILLLKIPGLTIVAKWLARFAGDDSTLAVICGYFTTLTIISKLSKEKATAELTCILLGAYLLIISIICLILNIIFGNPIWINILHGIAGIAFIIRRTTDAE